MFFVSNTLSAETRFGAWVFPTYSESTGASAAEKPKQAPEDASSDDSGLSSSLSTNLTKRKCTSFVHHVHVIILDCVITSFVRAPEKQGENVVKREPGAAGEPAVKKVKIESGTQPPLGMHGRIKCFRRIHVSPARRIVVTQAQLPQAQLPQPQLPQPQLLRAQLHQARLPRAARFQH